MTVDLPPPVPDTRSTAAATPVVSSPTSDGIRPGDLTLTWRLTLMAGWIAAFFAYAAVWQTSVQLGIATWWVGPRSQPTPTLIRMIPFIVTIVGGLLTVYNVRRVSLVSLAASIGSLLIALPDLSRSVGLAVVEMMISAALIVLSASSLTGRYRLGVAEADNALGSSPGSGNTTRSGDAKLDVDPPEAPSTTTIPNDAI